MGRWMEFENEQMSPACSQIPAGAAAQPRPRALSRWPESQDLVTEKAMSGAWGPLQERRGKSGARGYGSLCVNKWHLGTPWADSRALGKHFQRRESLSSGNSWGRAGYLNLRKEDVSVRKECCGVLRTLRPREGQTLPKVTQQVSRKSEKRTPASWIPGESLAWLGTCR